MNRYFLSSFTVIVGLVVVGVGCGSPTAQLEQKIGDKIAEGIVEKSTGGQVNIDSGKDKVTFTDKKSGTSMAFGESLKLPDDFPKDVPIYPESKVKGILNLKQDGQGLNVTLESSDSYNKVGDWYRAEFKKAGWAEETSYLMEGSAMLTYAKDKVSIGLILSQGDEENPVTSIVLTRGEKS